MLDILLPWEGSNGNTASRKLRISLRGGHTGAHCGERGGFAGVLGDIQVEGYNRQAQVPVRHTRPETP